MARGPAYSGVVRQRLRLWREESLRGAMGRDNVQRAERGGGGQRRRADVEGYREGVGGCVGGDGGEGEEVRRAWAKGRVLR